MSPDEQTGLGQYRSWSTEDLVNASTVESADYESWALSAIRAELQRRQISPAEQAVLMDEARSRVEPDRAERHPLLAALLSFVTLGLGDAYNGFPRKGFKLVATSLGFMLAGVAVFMYASEASGLVPPRWLMVAFLAPVPFYAVGIVRAWRDARRLRDVPRPDHTLRRCVTYVLVLLVVAYATRTFAVQAFTIPSGAMLPTLQIGDHILVNKFVYGPRLEIPLTQMSLGRLPGLRQPRRGDVVVFVWPKDRSKDFIKRVVAVDGETIEVRNRQVFIDGKAWDDPHATWTMQRSVGGGAGDNFGPYTVPKDHVFVMGDNRDQSYDSRFWGPVPISDIKGRAFAIYWSGDSNRFGELVR
jgi:signal peptidase I